MIFVFFKFCRKVKKKLINLLSINFTVFFFCYVIYNGDFYIFLQSHFDADNLLYPLKADVKLYNVM